MSYRNQYVCENTEAHRPASGGQWGGPRQESWEAFTDKIGEDRPCPVCGKVCTPISSEWAEHNPKAVAAWNGTGCGMVLGSGEADPLKTLTDPQLEALLAMILVGDIDEVPIDEVTLGKWAKNAGNDAEALARSQMAAALVYLSGRIANDVALLVD